MLSPRKAQVILLPEDRQLMEILGWDEDQYRYFVRQASTFNHIRPGDPVAFLFIPFLVKLVIGLALSYLASRLSRKSSNNAPAQLNTNQIDGQNIVSGGRYAPRTGFGSTQNVVEMGSVIPVVFAKRELIDGIWYGGVRVNTNLLWSQMFSIGTGQLLRAVFMVGEGPIGALDPYQFAIGDNLLGSYELDTAGNTSGRCSIYFRPGGGLIRSSDHIAGRLAAYDDGNAENSGGASVFDVRGVNQVYGNAFCYVSKPNNQTAFGIYSGMGNNLGYRVNPTIRSTSNPQLKPLGNTSNSYVTCNWDSQGKAERFKQNVVYSSRSGMWAYNGSPTSNGQLITLNVGDTVDYHLSSGSDYGTVFAWLLPPIATAKCVDVAQTVAGRQRQWDDSIVLGELYKFGQALLICVSRTPDDAVFISEADSEPAGGGVSITARFRVIKGGLAQFTSAAEIGRGGLTPGGPRNNGTQTSHLFRCAVSSFVVDRPTQVIEIGYKSTLGLRYSGLCNFRDSYSYFWSDLVSCDLYAGAIVGAGQTFNTSSLTSGTVSLPDKRYSFFRVMYRIAGSDAAFTEIDVNFCFCSQTEQPSFNYLRLQFSSAQRWEIMHRPTTGWEIRNGLCAGPLLLLDSRSAGAMKTGAASGVVFNYSGEYIANGPGTFGLAPTIPRLGDLGLTSADGASYVDAYGALAEMFLFEEIQSTANQPEHEVAYVNLISPNPTIPTYANLATIGLTLRSGPGFAELSQLSAYVNSGYGNTHLFPECYYIALTNSVFGAGDILSPAQINAASFAYSATWTQGRKYFFDAGISASLNLRSKGAEWAKLFLLDLSTKNGQFYLNPIAEFGKVYSPVAMFTSGNADSVEVTERDSQERQPIRVSVKWREERQSSDTAGRGLFPVIREITVREAGTPDSAPLVPIVMDEFCTSELHAIDVGKMRCREQVLITHDVKLQLIPDRAALEPGAVFKVGLELLTYEQPNNGVILSDGTATTTTGTPLSDGTYDVVLWDGFAANLSEVTIAVVDGKVTGYTNAVFCLADAVQAEQIFKAQVIDYDEDGNLEVIASYFPVEDDGTSSLLKNWTTPGAWVIEGLVGAAPADTPLAPIFSGVRINGPSSAVRATPTPYIAEIDGPSDAAYTYSWTGTNATIATPNAASTNVTFPNAGTGILNLTVTKTVGGTVRSTSKTIEVTLTSANALSIGSTPSAYRVGAGTFALTADIASPYTTATFSWTLSGQGVLSSPTSASTTLTVTNTVGSRFISLSAVIDGINYSAIRSVTVFTDSPLSIAGPAIIASGDTTYSAVLGSEVPPGDWVYAWNIIQRPPVLPPAAAFAFSAPVPVVSAAAYIDLPPSTFTFTAPAPDVFASSGAPPVDPYFDYVSLLLKFNGPNTSQVFTDLSRYGRALTAVGNAQISTAQSVFGGSSLLLDGSGDYISMAAAAELDLTGDFTIELRVYPLGTSDYILMTSTAQNVQVFRLNEGGAGTLSSYLNGTQVFNATAASVTANAWQELCICRSGSNTRLFRNGVQIGSTNTSWTGTFNIDRIGGALGLDPYCHIDELRVTKGVARYVANYTPSATDFPTRGIAYAEDPYEANVSLRLPLNGANSATSFPDTSTNNLTVTAVGNAQISTAQSKWAGSSLLLDGTGDYLSIPDDNVLDFGTGDFTIECWARFTSIANTPLIFYKGNSSTSSPGWWGQVAAGNMYFGFQTNSASFYATFTTTLTTGVWYHLSFCRVGDRLYTSVNGTVQSAVVTNADLSQDNTNAFLIGTYAPVNSLYDLNGNVQDFRVTKGVARYTANFTPPTASFTTTGGLDPYINNVQLFLPFNGPDTSTDIKDYSPANRIVALSGNAQLSTAQFVFGGSSLLLDGTGDYLTIASPPIELREWWTSDFTLELRGRFTAFTDTVGQPVTIGNMDPASGANYWSFGPRADGKLVFYYYNGTPVYVVGTTTLSANTQYALSVTLSGTTIRLFIDGVLDATATVSGTPQSSSSTPISIGVCNSVYTNGYIDELRLTKGVSRFTATYTPFTIPILYQDRYITSRSLMLHGEGANASTAIVDSTPSAFPILRFGNAQISTATPCIDTSSLLFDGSGDYLKIPTNTVFDFGTGDFTLEAYLFAAAYSNDTFILSSSGSGGLFFGFFNPSTIGLGRTTVAWDHTVAHGLSTSALHHVAVTRQGSSLRFFANGTQVGSTFTNTTSYNLSTGSLTVGSQGANYYINARLDEIRVTKGVARYVANFRLPPGPFPDL